MDINESKRFTVSVITHTEAKEKLADNFDIISLVNKSEKNRICKAEVYPSFLALSFSVPSKTNLNDLSRFLCIITEENVLFVDDSGKVGYCIKKMQKTKSVNEDSISRFVYDFLETLIESELRYLEAFNDRITKIENSIVNGDFDKFENRMISIKKEILVFYRYYSQLIDIGKELRENENRFFDEEGKRYFRLFSDRVEQFYSESKMLREYILQLRGIYQTQFDINQNKVMKVLTVVTTVFSPLTIIVGWYGMNFVNMPELSWEYGYTMVIILSILTVFVSIWMLKKNKFL